MQGGKGQDVTMGLLPLQTSLLKESKKHLFVPLKYMFPEAVSVDEDGNAQKVTRYHSMVCLLLAHQLLTFLSVLSDTSNIVITLRLDTNIREELSLYS